VHEAGSGGEGYDCGWLGGGCLDEGGELGAVVVVVVSVVAVKLYLGAETEQRRWWRRRPNLIILIHGSLAALAPCWLEDQVLCTYYMCFVCIHWDKMVMGFFRRWQDYNVGGDYPVGR
jgi:hypothetical protein